MDLALNFQPSLSKTINWISYIDNKMNQSRVIPDSVLESMVCRSCFKYLSVGPIGVHPGGGNICGRCLYKKNAPKFLFEFDPNQQIIDEDSIPFLIFAYINHLFPCVNRFEGCKALLAFNAVREHELHCKSKKSICKNCNYIGIGSQLVYHFRNRHPALVDHNNFLVDLGRDVEATFLVKEHGCLVFVDFEFRKNDRKIKFNCTLFGGSEIGLIFNLTDCNGQLIDQIPFSTNHFNEKNQFCHIITYSEEDFNTDNHLYCKFEINFDTIKL